MMPSLPVPLMNEFVMFRRIQVPTVAVDAQLAGLKKLATIPLAATFCTVLESLTEKGVSRLLIPSLLVLVIVVFLTISRKFSGTNSGLAGMGPLSSEIPVFAQLISPYVMSPLPRRPVASLVITRPPQSPAAGVQLETR